MKADLMLMTPDSCVSKRVTLTRNMFKDRTL